MIALLLVLLMGAAAVDTNVPADDEYDAWFEKDEIVVQRAETGDPDRPWIRSSYEYPVNADTIRNYLCDFASYEEMFAPGLKDVEVLENGEPCHARLHLVWKFPFPWKNRDGIVKYTVEQPSDDHFVLHWVGDAQEGDPSDGIRIDGVFGATHVQRVAADKTIVVYEYKGDLGGKFPEWFKEAAWKAEPTHFHSQLRHSMGLGKAGEPWPAEPGAKALEHWNASRD